MAQFEPVRFAYIGCGFLAQSVHIPNFAALPECEILALAEVRTDLGKTVAATYGIPKVYPSHIEVARDPEIEAVGVSAPYTIQGRIAEDLLAAGKHVFMEKPMAVSVSRAEAMLSAAEESGARLMVGYMKRYDAGNALLKENLDQWRHSGECGELVFARNHGFGGNWLRGQDPNIPMVHSDAVAPSARDECPTWLPHERHDSYLGYLQQWTHNANLLRYLLGDTGGQTELTSVDLDDDGMTGLVTLRINGVRAVVESACTKAHTFEEHPQIYFERGWLRTNAPLLLQKESPAAVEIYRTGSDGALPTTTHVHAPASWSYREEAKSFLKCLRSGESFRSSGEDTFHDVRLFEEIYRVYLGV